VTGGRVFALPPGVDFPRHFAEGFFERMADASPEEVARTRILVPTNRARDTIEIALADAAPRPGPLPRLVMIPDLHAASLLAPDLPFDPALDSALDVPPALSPACRHLHLTRLVERFLEARTKAGERIAPTGAASGLAAELALLIDQMHDADLGAEALDQAAEGAGLTDEAARHWTDMRAFLDLVCAAWPAIRAEEAGGELDPGERQRRVIDGLVAHWASDPPETPVIAAGSTGSVTSTSRLLAAVARLPRGAVVLPGLEPRDAAAVWDAVAEDHPMGPFRGLLDELEIEPDELPLWATVPHAPRATLLSQALRPAPVTDHWHRAAPALSEAFDAATAGLSIFEADSPRHEADGIAVAIREALERPGRRVALVSPDASLARRVTAALAAFDVTPDDTIGRPLRLSPPGRLLHLALDVASDPSAPVTLVALLQHPLTLLGFERRAHLAHARAFERKVLRREANWPELPRWDGAKADALAWHGALSDAMAPLSEALGGNAGLEDLLVAHVETLDRLSRAPDGTSKVRAKEDGKRLAERLQDLVRDAPAFGTEPVADYPALLSSLFADAHLRPRSGESHPRVTICGTREARFMDADLMILAGLNEGAWPPVADPGPWLGRPMRRAAGLPLPERSLGLSAHDFLQAAARPEVLITRARKIEGAATVASRWLIRIETLVRGIRGDEAYGEILGRGARLGEIAARRARPTAPVPRAACPRATPPLDARPRRLSVTAIETLIRDAYAIYARRVLDLKPLDSLGRTLDPRDRGTIVHDLLERFVEATDPWPGRARAAEILARLADEALAKSASPPDLRRIWRARIDRFADWFLDEEDSRRAEGKPLALEIQGSMILDLPGGPFEIVAKVDRIDRLNDGSAAIYDYKTGQPPTGKQVGVFNHQLHVAAAILREGGFQDLESMETAKGAYIGLTGADSGGTETAVPDLGSNLDEYLARLRELLSGFDEGDPYVAHSRPLKVSYSGDYDHLARYGEWEEGEE